MSSQKSSETPSAFSQKQRNDGRGSNPRSLQNLRPFQPGQSGNPGGLPKGTPKVSVAYMHLLKLSPEEFQAFKPKTTAEAIAYRQIYTAIYGYDALPAAKEICDRTEGKARQAIDVSNVTDIEKERAMFEAAIKGVMADSGCTYTEAVRALVTVNPENERFILE